MDRGVSRGKGFLSELIFDTEVAGIIQIFLANYQWGNIWARWIYKDRHCIVALLLTDKNSTISTDWL